jgi:hypothetical protein
MFWVILHRLWSYACVNNVSDSVSPSAFCFDLIANQLFQVHRATRTINAELSIDLFYGKEKTF